MPYQIFFFRGEERKINLHQLTVQPNTAKVVFSAIKKLTSDSVEVKSANEHE